MCVVYVSYRPCTMNRCYIMFSVCMYILYVYCKCIEYAMRSVQMNQCDVAKLYFGKEAVRHNKTVLFVILCAFCSNTLRLLPFVQTPNNHTNIRIPIPYLYILYACTIHCTRTRNYTVLTIYI